MTRIVLHIDRLVLRGIDRYQAAAIADGLKVELARQLTAPGKALALEGATARIDAGRQRLGTASGAEMGALLAGNIARTLGR